MFSKTVVKSDFFLEMPVSSQLLYFHLGIEADDDGFVTPRVLMRTIGASEDDLKVLIAKKFVIPFESGVIVLSHWHENNYIQKDRYTPTIYSQEKSRIAKADNDVYILDTSSTRSIGKYSKGEDIHIEIENPKKEKTNLEGFESFWSIYPKKANKVTASAEWRPLTKGERDLILADIPKRLMTETWKNGFIPMPSNYLKDRRWEDEIKDAGPNFMSFGKKKV